jgi:hypothetical protein
MAPPAPDTRCPNQTSPIGSFTGCCTNNDCGLDLSMFGAGCVDTSSAMVRMFLMNITPMHCDGTPFPVGTGGTSGGGGAAGAAGMNGGGTSGGGGASGGGGTSGAAGAVGASGGGGTSGAAGAAGSAGTGGSP